MLSPTSVKNTNMRLIMILSDNFIKALLAEVICVYFLFRESEASEDQLLGFKRLRRYDGVRILPDVPLLQPPNVYRSKVACGMVCASHSDCSIFAFNTLSSICKLYPPAVYPANTFTLAATIPGETYYAHYSDSCPVTDGFMLDRETGLCFYVSEVKKTWSESITACADMGARLMIIDDIARQNKIVKILENDNSVKSEHIWIGGSDLNPGDNIYRFHWIDGSEVVNYFWGGDQPNGQLYGEYCLGINKAVLYDRVCSHDYRFYCDIPN